MPHPDGGRGNHFSTKHSFEQAYKYVGADGVSFKSTTGENMRATHGWTQDKQHMTIVFIGERTTHGNVCSACWGYANNCAGTVTGTMIGHCVKGLDKKMEGE